MKGTPSFGKKNKRTHIRCPRCGRHSYHIRKKRCAACGWGASKRMRRYSWENKNKITGIRYR